MTRTLLLSAALIGLFLAAGTAGAADETPSFKKRGDAEKQFVTKAGTAVIKAARTKPQKINLLSYEIIKPKANRTELTMKMEYFGLVTMKRYIADITFIIDSTDKDSWEVLNIRYSDNNPSPAGPSEKKIQALIKEFNK
jgi:hypothetical protein